MDDLQKMRASDADRQEVVGRSRAALDEGRLKMDEYLDRMALAFRLFRGSKLRLADVDPALIAEAMRPGSRLVARIRFTSADGDPGGSPNPSWSVDRP
jgi:Domain of unknown function (DUF1707)